MFFAQSTVKGHIRTIKMVLLFTIGMTVNTDLYQELVPGTQVYLANINN